MTMPNVLLGLVYAIISMVVVVSLLITGRMTRKIMLGISIVTASLGMLIQAPLLPLQMQSLVVNGSVGSGMSPILAIFVIAIMIVSSLFIGRAFCGYACPIGSLQEIVHALPGNKVKMRSKRLLFGIHVAITSAFFALGLIWSEGLLWAIGVKDLFYLDIAAGAIVIFLIILVAGIFFYRPFCRLICPFGLFSELLARSTLFRIVKKDGCNSCKRCERYCPTGTMNDGANPGDCFLCLRCEDACKRGSIGYQRRVKK